MIYYLTFNTSLYVYRGVISSVFICTCFNNSEKAQKDDIENLPKGTAVHQSEVIMCDMYVFVMQ